MAKVSTASAIEKLLANGQPFQVDQINCMNHAKILKAFHRHKEVFPWSTRSKIDQLVFKVAFVSICHQFNWDFLQQRMYRVLLERDIDIVKCLCAVTARDIDSLLADYPDKTRIRAKERAKLLRNVGSVLTTRYDGDLRAFYSECEEAPLGNGSFHEILDRFEAYRRDPLKKKTNVLSHDLHSESILRFQDPDNMEPAIDYHIMRVYLRTGRVIFASEAVGAYLRGSPNPRGALVRALRQTVSDALRLTARYADMSVADLNFVEWQIGRSICVNIEPRCDFREYSKPLSEDVDVLCQAGCAYRTVCVARNELHSFMLLEEPRYISTSY